MRKTNTIFDMPIEPLLFRKYPRLWLKYCWYKYIKRMEIIGFIGGKPIYVSENLEELK